MFIVLWHLMPGKIEESYSMQHGQSWEGSRQHYQRLSSQKSSRAESPSSIVSSLKVIVSRHQLCSNFRVYVIYGYNGRIKIQFADSNADKGASQLRCSLNPRALLRARKSADAHRHCARINSAKIIVIDDQDDISTMKRSVGTQCLSDYSVNWYLSIRSI